MERSKSIETLVLYLALAVLVFLESWSAMAMGLRGGWNLSGPNWQYLFIPACLIYMTSVVPLIIGGGLKSTISRYAGFASSIILSLAASFWFYMLTARIASC